MSERFKLIKPYIEDKDVLDIGICDWCDQLIRKNAIPYETPEHWIHDDIKKCAKSVLGIDILEECIESLKDRGYDVKLSNAENFDFNRKFDVIVAGELIEHLTNLQGFFNSAKKHLKEDGLLILTTPNTFHFRQMLFLVLRGYPAVNLEHVCWFDEITLRQTLDRFDFSIVKISYMTEKQVCATTCKKAKQIFLILFEKLIPFRKVKYATIIVIAKHKNV